MFVSRPYGRLYLISMSGMVLGPDGLKSVTIRKVAPTYISI